MQQAAILQRPAAHPTAPMKMKYLYSQWQRGGSGGDGGSVTVNSGSDSGDCFFCGIFSGSGLGATISGGGAAPNNATTQNPRATQCKIKVGVGIGLDVAGTALSFASGAGEGIVVAQVNVGLASAAYSADNGSAAFTLANAGGAQVSAVTAGASGAGFKTAGTALTTIGRGLSAASLIYDVFTAKSSYESCLAGH